MTSSEISLFMFRVELCLFSPISCAYQLFVSTTRQFHNDFPRTKIVAELLIVPSIEFDTLSFRMLVVLNNSKPRENSAFFCAVVKVNAQFTEWVSRLSSYHSSSDYSAFPQLPIANAILCNWEQNKNYDSLRTNGDVEMFFVLKSFLCLCPLWLCWARDGASKQQRT